MTARLPDAPDITVLMATRNRADSLERTLSGLVEQCVPAGLVWDLIVSDNGSADATPGVLRAYTARLPLHSVVVSQVGKNRALNRALDLARGRLLVFIDDDIVIDPNWLAALWHASARWPDAAIFGGRIEPLFPPHAPAWLREKPFVNVAFGRFAPDQGEGPMSLPPFGTCVAIRRDALAGQRFREDLGPQGVGYPMGGDTELLRRIVASGALMVYVPGAKVQHVIRESQISRVFLNQRAFNYGRGLELTSNAPVQAPSLFGIPRWMWRAVAESRLRQILGMVIGSAQRRGQDAWRVHTVRGQIEQARLQRSAKD